MQKPSGTSSSYLAANCFPLRLVATRTEAKFGALPNVGLTNIPKWSRTKSTIYNSVLGEENGN
jgi:hypothetical protein